MTKPKEGLLQGIVLEYTSVIVTKRLSEDSYLHISDCPFLNLKRDFSLSDSPKNHIRRIYITEYKVIARASDHKEDSSRLDVAR